MFGDGFERLAEENLVTIQMIFDQRLAFERVEKHLAEQPKKANVAGIR